jgi:hypothetical protein
LSAGEKILGDPNASDFIRLVRSIGEVRHAGGPRDHSLWRLHPERWLESLVVQNVAAVDERLDASRLYSQVPAFSASDRAMIDVLTVTRDGRLAVVELKADEESTCPCRDSIIGHASPGITRDVNSSASDIFRERNC